MKAKRKERAYLPIEVVAEQLEAARLIVADMLRDRLATEDTKLNSKAQEPNRIEVAINSALLVGLVSIIFWAGIHPYFMPL